MHPSLPFMISDQGDVWSIESGRTLKQAINNYGYHVVSGGLLVHHLVFETFHGPIRPEMEVDHIDRNTDNNAASNLRLVTRSHNALNRCTSLPNPYKT